MFENLKKLGCSGDCGSCGSDSATCGEKPTPDSCTHNCKTCPSGGSCGEFDPKSLLEDPNPGSNVKKVIAVVSGKGGVGKSLVTSLMATTMRRRGNQVAVMDADVTGPSIPKEFGVTDKAEANELGIIPLPTSTGIKTMSINNLLENDTDPVLWRGPVIAGLIKQFWTDVCWGDVDYMFVDMPPGTGDVPLTVFQSLPVDGIIVVTSPQDLVRVVVSKAIKMAEMMNVPVLGLVENYSYFKCPDCGKETQIFGPSRVDEVAAEFGLDVLAKLPIDPSLAGLCDRGMIEMFEGDWLEKAADKL